MNFIFLQVNEALKAQVDTLWHTTSIYMHPKIHEYAEKLTATLPEPLKCVYFVNSGSEANDMAMMMARVYTGNFDILSFRNAYHGEWKGWRKGAYTLDIGCIYSGAPVHTPISRKTRYLSGHSAESWEFCCRFYVKSITVYLDVHDFRGLYV